MNNLTALHESKINSKAKNIEWQSKLLRGHSDSDEDLSQNKKQCVFSLISINNTEVSFNI